MSGDAANGSFLQMNTIYQNVNTLTSRRPSVSIANILSFFSSSSSRKVLSSAFQALDSPPELLCIPKGVNSSLSECLPSTPRPMSSFTSSSESTEMVRGGVLVMVVMLRCR